MPKLPTGNGTAFLRISRVAADLGKVIVASVVVIKDGKCEDVRIALGAVAPTPIRVKNAEDVLKGKRIESKLIEQAAEIAATESKPITDIRSTKEYRKELIKVLVRQAINISCERAKKGLVK